MSDLILEGMLESNLPAARQVNADSDIVTLAAEGAPGSLPRAFHGVMEGMQYYARESSGAFAPSDAPLGFSLNFPDDYCRSVDPNLQFRIISTESRAVSIRQPTVRHRA